MSRRTLAVAVASAALLALSAGNTSAQSLDFSARGDSANEACSRAKFEARRQLRNADRTVRSFDSCSCRRERDSSGAQTRSWRCTVVAHYTRPR